MRATDVPETELSLPTALTSARATLVYLFVRVRGAATATEIAQSLDIGIGSTLSIVRTLRDRGLIERDGERFVPA